MEDLSEESRQLRSTYLHHFDPSALHKTFFVSYSSDTKFVVKSMYEALEKYIVRNPAHKLKILDFGCAINPTNAAAAISTGAPLDIVMSDFLPQNRETLTKWVNKEDDAPRFDVPFRFISSLSGKSASDIENLTRQSISKIEEYDLHQDFSRDNGKYDVIMTTFCLDKSCTSKEEYGRYMKKLVALLADGGILVIAVALMETAYRLGETVLSHVTLTQEEHLHYVRASGLEVLSVETRPTENMGPFFGDNHANCIVAAKKTA